MPLPDDYLIYPRRRHGMDHDRYSWSNLFDRRPLRWPGDARVALWVTPILQWFPIDMTGKPFRAPGGLTMPYPDYRHYTNRDYGNRVGIFRILELMHDLGLPGSVAVNGRIAGRYPALMRHLVDAGLEVIGHGLDMERVHHSGLSPEDEATLVEETLGLLRQATGQGVSGWLSPGRAQSYRTPEILASHGIAYCCDWVNDDLPYPMRTDNGSLYSMPLAWDTEDQYVLLELHQTEECWVGQLKDRFDTLYREADRYGGRIMSIPAHAWVSGVPFRVGYLREALEYILGHERVWPATGADILAEFLRQAGTS